jgi:hypothetical protein
MSKHTFSCKKATIHARHEVWSDCHALRSSKPSPIESEDPCESALSLKVGSTSLKRESTIAGVGVSRGQSHHIARSMDTLTNTQADQVTGAVMKFFVANRLPFQVVESPSFITLLRSLRPAYVQQGHAHSRQVSGRLLELLYVATQRRVLEMLRGWENNALTGGRTVLTDTSSMFLLRPAGMSFFLILWQLGTIGRRKWHRRLHYLRFWKRMAGFDYIVQWSATTQRVALLCAR